MITRDFEITLRIPETSYIPNCFQVTQNDKDVYNLEVHITDGITEIDYAQVSSATITFSKADGNVVQGDMTVGASSLTYTMGTNEIAHPGPVLASVQLFGAGGERLTSARFKFDVVKDLITPAAVQSTSEFPILQQLKQDLEAIDVVELTSEFNAHKADSATENKTLGKIIMNNNTPVITIIDDDTSEELYSMLFPIITSYNIPISAAAITGAIGTTGHITYEQFEILRDSGLVEFVNHTHNHIDLTTVSLEVAENEIKTCEEWLAANGVKSSGHLVYPFGNYNRDIIKIAQKYVNSGSLYYKDVPGFLHIITPSSEHIENYLLPRITFEYALSGHEYRIDKIAEEKGWIILNTHSGYETFDTDKLCDIIDYAFSKGVEFVTLSEGLRRFGNVIEISNQSKYIGSISSSGKGFGAFRGIAEYIGALNANDPITDYPVNVSTMILNNTAIANGWSGAGIVTTYRPQESDDYAYQTFKPIRKYDMYVRYWHSASSIWSEFRSLAPDDEAIVEVDSYTIAAGAMQNVLLIVNAVTKTDTVIMTPRIALPNEIDYVAYADYNTNTYVRLRLINTGLQERIIPAGDWHIKILKNNK